MILRLHLNLRWRIIIACADHQRFFESFIFTHHRKSRSIMTSRSIIAYSELGAGEKPFPLEKMMGRWASTRTTRTPTLGKPNWFSRNQGSLACRIANARCRNNIAAWLVYLVSSVDMKMVNLPLPHVLWKNSTIPLFSTVEFIIVARVRSLQIVHSAVVGYILWAFKGLWLV